MVPSDVPLPFSQGDVLYLSKENISQLDLSIDDDKLSAAVVISHDCDIAADINREPFIEIIVGGLVTALGSASYGKNPRVLHLECSDSDQTIVLEFRMINKYAIAKDKLNALKPSKIVNLSDNNKRILKRWLSSRYNRSAFPDSFEGCLKSKKLSEKIEKILSVGSHSIRALLFDLRNSTAMPPAKQNQLFSLGIVILYDRTVDAALAEQSADEARIKLEDLFEKAFDGCKSNEPRIHLAYCDIISDQVIPLAQSEKLQQWRLEHVSLRSDN